MKKKTPMKPVRKAEGGDITSARTLGQEQRYIRRQMADSGGVAGALNRAVQKATQPKAKVAEMEKKAQKAKRSM